MLITRTFTNSRQLSNVVVGDAAFQEENKQLIRLCAEAEGRMELYWAKRIIEDLGDSILDSSSAGAILQRWLSTLTPRREPSPSAPDDSPASFPYASNYSALVRLEHGLLVACGASFRQVVFVGSGPMPLTSLVLARQHLSHDKELGGQGDEESWTLINVDNDVEALKTGAEFAAAVLGLSLETTSTFLPDQPLSSISLDCMSATSSGSLHFLPHAASCLPASVLSGASVVYLASLVGLAPDDKIQIAIDVLGKMSEGSLLLMRSADGLRSVVYPVVDEDKLVEAAAKARIMIKTASAPRE
ncbi:hypothetical protein JCM5296_000753 [Sporobolomyces johnsonii]